MADEVTQLPSSPTEDPPSPEGRPSADPPLIDRETNIMTQSELNCLRESCSFPSSIQIRLPKANETIASTRPGEVAFYEAAFHAGLHLPIRLIIRRIMYFYNICPVQLVPNAWRSLVWVVVLWRVHKFSLSLNEFRSLFTLYKNLKPDSGWLYFKARSKKTMLGGASQQRQGMKKSSSWEMTGSSPWGYLGTPGVQGVLPLSGKRCNKPPVLSTTEQQRLNGILDSLVERDTFTIKEALESKSFCRCFRLTSKSMTRIYQQIGQLQSQATKVSLITPEMILADVIIPETTRKLELKLNLGGLVRTMVAPQAQIKCEVSPAAKEVVIGKKCPWDEMPDIMPTKKGKKASDAKKKGTMSPLEDKRMATSSKAESKGEIPIMVPEEVTSAYLGAVLGLNASILKNPTVAKKLLEGMIPPLDKEEMSRLDLDLAISRLFHGVGQELEGQVAKIGAREQQVVEELKKMKEGQDATVARLEAEVTEMKKKKSLAKKSAIEEYKSSDEFQEAIDFITSKYFGKDFDFCKRQISRLHPDLDIQGMGIDVDMLEEEEEEEKEEEKVGEPDNSPAPLCTLFFW
ncbi:hypothetical protein Acr_20g0010820 [Actinidia rufa]|uniref:Uncharacterized protein n=1 Tax=Actinidia rufa TaxID=165716 RepID=A0A7J0GEQ6_9ERIC|nr:hypothetical protein Acr_20g0010820 [Actinidia rufa]